MTSSMFKVLRYHGVLPPLYDLWRRSVEATHDFLLPVDIDFYAGVLKNALPGLEVWTAVDDNSRVLGFMALSKNEVEMLFVEPTHFSQGVGQTLLKQALTLKKKLRVCVNEQNPKAHAFYQKFGFKPIERMAIDGTGRPYPLIRMEY